MYTWPGHRHGPATTTVQSIRSRFSPLGQLEVDRRLREDGVVVVDVHDLNANLHDLEVRHRVHGDVERHEAFRQAGTDHFTSTTPGQ